MDDNELKRLLQEGMDYEADRIMAEVESDPSLKDVVAPEEIYTKLKQQIHEHQEEEERDRESRAKEDEELIRLGKIYKKKRARRKYYVLLVAVLCALGVGTVSFGDGKKVFTKISRMLGDRKQTVVNTENGDEDRIEARDVLDEEEVYKQIKEKFGFSPVRMVYLPEGMQFVEGDIEDETQNARLYYKGAEGKSIIFRVITDNRIGSVNADIEDVYIGEYERTANNINALITEYEIKENKASRWSVVFEYKDAQYTLIVTGIQQQEVEKIVDNLYLQ